MSEWWTYRPSDFLMFSPRAYWRTVELQNEAWWPLQGLVLLAGLAWIAWTLKTRRALTLRIAAAALAVSWAFVAFTFVWQRYAAINWAASWFAVGLAGLSLGLLVLATRGDLQVTSTPARLTLGLSMTGFSLLGYPAMALVFGRPWQQAEVVALSPDPTVMATAGLLMCTATAGRATRRWAILSVSLCLAWCVISAATLWTMGSPQGWLMAAAAAVLVWQGSCAGSRTGDG